tara:strand:+ start:778 stop:987 length:210 start_codon:yes stop_codon:yes gene_type:complete
MNEDDFFDINDYDYMVGGIAGYCMSDMNKDQLWVILNHVDTAPEFCWAQQAQEDLNNLVNDYYEGLSNG